MWSSGWYFVQQAQRAQYWYRICLRFRDSASAETLGIWYGPLEQQWRISYKHTWVTSSLTPQSKGLKGCLHIFILFFKCNSYINGKYSYIYIGMHTRACLNDILWKMSLKTCIFLCNTTEKHRDSLQSLGSTLFSNRILMSAAWKACLWDSALVLICYFAWM